MADANLLDPRFFLFDLPLYTEILLDGIDNEFLDLMDTRTPIDEYNPIIKEQTTYNIYGRPGDGVSIKYSAASYSGVRTFILRCVRTNAKFYFYLNVYAKKVQEKNQYYVEKIGQWPSIADFHISQIKEYHNVLPKEKLREFTKAIGLAANGVGIGSFVYLRRIFEHLIEEAHVLATKDEGWNDNEYVKLRMAEKINLLAAHLPPFLVEHKSLYSILSKGVHELEEQECLEYFDPIRAGIELILDEKLETYNKEKKMKEAKARIAAISQKVSEKK